MMDTVISREEEIRKRVEEIDFEIMVLDINRSFNRELVYNIINKLMNEKKKLMELL